MIHQIVLRRDETNRRWVPVGVYMRQDDVDRAVAEEREWGSTWIIVKDLELPE